MPALVVPAEATTAKTLPSAPPSTRARAGPVSLLRSSPGTSRTRTPMTSAAERIEEWASAAQARLQPPSGSGGRPAERRRCWAVCRAATSAERFPVVPPLTNVPPAVAGQPSSVAIQPSTWFSAWMAPAPVSQWPPKMFATLVARSKATAARVGADGM